MYDIFSQKCTKIHVNCIFDDPPKKAKNLEKYIRDLLFLFFVLKRVFLSALDKSGLRKKSIEDFFIIWA